jgi:hypothetical protein
MEGKGKEEEEGDNNQNCVVGVASQTYKCSFLYKTPANL